MRRLAISRFASDRSGIAAVEFALLAPFLIILIFTSFTVFQMVRASYVADRSTFTVGDLMSRQTETNTTQLVQMKAVFEHLVTDLNTTPELRITSLIRTAGGYVVDWTYSSRPQGSLARSEMPVAALPSIAVDDSILLTESVVSVQPFMNLLPAATGASMTFAHTATTRPRFVGRLTKVN